MRSTPITDTSFMSIRKRGYKTTEVEALYRSIEDRFHALPAWSRSASPLIRRWKTITGNRVKVQGETDLHKGSSWVKGTPEYFDSVGTHLVMGRDSRRRMCWVRPGCRGEPGIRQAVFRNAQPRRHRFGGSGPAKTARMRSSASSRTPPTPPFTGKTTPCIRSLHSARRHRSDIPSRKTCRCMPERLWSKPAAALRL